MNLYRTKRLKKIEKVLKKDEILYVDAEKSKHSVYWFIHVKRNGRYLYSRKTISGFGQVLKNPPEMNHVCF